MGGIIEILSTGLFAIVFVFIIIGVFEHRKKRKKERNARRVERTNRDYIKKMR